MKRLELIFENEDGKKSTYSIDNPIEPADAEAVENAMDEIVEQDLFMTSGGRLVKKVEARIVERTVTDIEFSYLDGNFHLVRCIIFSNILLSSIQYWIS